MANDFVFLFAQDWNYCRNFLSSTTPNSETLALPFPQRVNVPLSESHGWEASSIGYVREESVLDASPGPYRSGYETNYGSLLDSPDLRVTVTLPPPKFGITAQGGVFAHLPAYLGHFVMDSVQAFASQVTYDPVVLPSTRKGIHITISAKLT